MKITLWALMNIVQSPGEITQIRENGENLIPYFVTEQSAEKFYKEKIANPDPYTRPNAVQELMDVDGIPVLMVPDPHTNKWIYERLDKG